MIDLVQLRVSARGDSFTTLKRAIDRKVKSMGFTAIRLGSYQKRGIALQEAAAVVHELFEVERAHYSRASIAELIIVGGIDVVVHLKRPKDPSKGRAI